MMMWRWWHGYWRVAGTSDIDDNMTTNMTCADDVAANMAHLLMSSF